MGRKRNSDGGGPATAVEKKRKAVKTKLIEREHAGKVVGEYKLLEALIAEQHPDLADAKFVMVWKKGWRPDVDGVLVGARIKKSSELDKEFEEYDFVISLNFELWRETKISDEQKTILMDHELCHAAPEMDRDGEQKKDDRGRFCWRLRKPPITEFPEIIKRYGLGKVTGLNAKLLSALEDEKLREEASKDRNDTPENRPLFKDQIAGDKTKGADKAADKQTASDGSDAWKLHKLAVLKGKLSEKAFDALESTHLKTLGELQEKMNRHGEWWAKELGVHGRHREAIEQAFNEWILANQ